MSSLITTIQPTCEHYYHLLENWVKNLKAENVISSVFFTSTTILIFHSWMHPQKQRKKIIFVESSNIYESSDDSDDDDQKSLTNSETETIKTIQENQRRNHEFEEENDKLKEENEKLKEENYELRRFHAVQEVIRDLAHHQAVGIRQQSYIEDYCNQFLN